MVLLHIIALVCTGLFVLYADEQGLMWILGKKETLSKRSVQLVHAVVGVGLSVIILTGGLMAIPALEYYLGDPMFLVKMFFVGVLIINGLLIGAVSGVATRQSFASLTARERMPLLLSGVASAVSWIGAIVAGLLLGG